jgi:hypothetical protein
VNAGKATFYAETLLRRGRRLLALVNRQCDYWLKQEYRSYNDRAQVVWRAGEVGAWDVVFQPKKLLYTKDSTAPQKFHGI